MDHFCVRQNTCFNTWRAGFEMYRPVTIVAPGGMLLPELDYAQVQISDGASVNNVLVRDITNFEFLGGAGNLDTLGAPYFLGSVSNFQAGDGLTLQDVPAWTSFAYDPATESLNLSGAGGGVVASITISELVVGQYATSSFQVTPQMAGFVSITTSTGAVAPSVAVATTYGQAAVTAGPGGEQVTGPGIAMNVLLGQSLQFTDGTLSFDRGAFEPASMQLPTLFRLYETALGRMPDPVGESSWNSVINHGFSLENVANGFLASDEYQNAFSGLSNTDFITSLYQHGLGRTPDAGGLNYWNGILTSGINREDVLLGVSQSAEAIATNALVARAGIFTPNI